MTERAKGPISRAGAKPIPPMASRRKPGPGAKDRGLAKARGGIWSKRRPRFGRRSALVYEPGEGVGDFVKQIGRATPLQLVEVERNGVDGRFLKDMAHEMGIPTSRLFDMIGVAKATAEKKAATSECISGAGGQAAIGMARLLALVEAIAASSTADRSDFHAGKWLGQWLERPQPALGGKKPAELLDTPTGLEVVSRVLGAVESGTYQ